MGIKLLKPTSNGVRNMSVSSFDEITEQINLPNLMVRLKKNAGRNNQGRITVRHRGGGCKRFYRMVDFKRLKENVEAKVVAVMYDPNRSARIALIHYMDGEKSYILAPDQISIGQIVMSGEKAEIKVGNCLKLKYIPVGTIIHNIEMHPNRGGQIGRSAGTSIQFLAKDDKNATLKMPSGEIRIVNSDCRATIGAIGNSDQQNVKIGKAGRNRHLGIRPTVRGSAMNACDHPHGGGEGKAPIGHAGPMSPTGKPTLGYKTRKDKKPSWKFIIKRRDK